MNNYLLDTHAFLWMLNDDKRLSTRAKSALLNSRNGLFLSRASFWEIGIKVSKRKLSLAEDWSEQMDKERQYNRINWLEIRPNHCEQLTYLPEHHKDPFDRLFIVQAQCENLTVLTCDKAFSDYEIDILW